MKYQVKWYELVQRQAVVEARDADEAAELIHVIEEAPIIDTEFQFYGEILPEQKAVALEAWYQENWGNENV